MRDIARLAVGIILLGLAIFLSLNFEETPVSTAGEQVDSGVSKEPDWQATPDLNASFTGQNQDPDFARPQFDAAAPIPARPLSSINEGSIKPDLPPNIGEQYQPMQPLVVTGQLTVDDGLVPVQPKPSFTGSISYVHEIHTIREGDTLQSIAREYFGTAERYLDIYLLNKDVLSNPAYLPPGVEIRIPGQ